jgi:hypothetical protein
MTRDQSFKKYYENALFFDSGKKQEQTQRNPGILELLQLVESDPPTAKGIIYCWTWTPALSYKLFPSARNSYRYTGGTSFAI